MISTAFLVILWLSTFFMERLAELLNLQTASKPLAEKLSQIQSPEEHQKALNYLVDRTRLGWMRETLLTLGVSAMILWGGFSFILNLASRLSSNPLWVGLLFAAIFSLLQGIVSLPFTYYSTFVIEEEHGFNRTTLATFIGDLLKGAIVGILIGTVLYFFAFTLLNRLGNHAWFSVWIGYSLFQILITWIAPVTILPLFLKLTPLPDGDLKNQIETYAKAQSFKLDGAWVCDASKRSAKSNAFFTGFGRFRRLVLFDTLIEKHTPEEIVAVVAHEAGHFKLGHIWKGSLFGLAMSAVFLFVIQKLIQSHSLYSGFGVSPPSIGVGLFLALTLISRMMVFFQFVSSYFSRKHEYEADEFSIRTSHLPDALISGLKRLTLDNKGILVHHPFYVALYASHPPLLDRIRAIEELVTMKGAQA